MFVPLDPAAFVAARYRANAATMLLLASLRPLDAATVQLAIEAALQLRTAENLAPIGRPS